MSDVKQDLKYNLDVAGHNIYVASVKSLAWTLRGGVLALPVITGLTGGFLANEYLIDQQGSIDTHNPAVERAFTEDLDARLEEMRANIIPEHKPMSVEDYIIENALDYYTDEDELARIAQNEASYQASRSATTERVAQEDSFYTDLVMNGSISEDSFEEYARKFNDIATQEFREIPAKAHNFHDECRVEHVKNIHQKNLVNNRASLDASIVVGCMRDAHAEFKAANPEGPGPFIFMSGMMGLFGFTMICPSVFRTARRMEMNAYSKKKPKRKPSN